MNEDTPQFFGGTTPRRAQRANRAVYALSGKDRGGNQLSIAVECMEGGGNTPRNATSLADIKKKLDLDRELAAVAAVTEDLIKSLSPLRPGDMEIEFGVELGGQMGIPLVTKGEAKANFKITLKWGGAGSAQA